MNKIYKTKFNPATGEMMVCSELSKNRGKTVSKVVGVMMASVLSCGVALANANAVPNALTEGRDASANYTAEAIQLAKSDSSLLNLSDDQAKETKHFHHNDDIVEKDFKFKPEVELISAGGKVDNADPKATLSFNKVDVTLTEETPTAIPATFNGYGVRVAHGGGVFVKDLTIKVDGVKPVSAIGRPNLSAVDLSKHKIEVVVNAGFDGVLAGVIDGKDASKDLKNEVVLDNYTFTFERPANTEIEKRAEQFTALSYVNAISAIQGNDSNKQAAHSLVTVSGDFKAKISNTEGYGVNVRGGKVADNPIPVVTLGNTDIMLNVAKGHTLSVGASPIRKVLVDFTSPPPTPKYRELPDGWGAGKVVFTKDAKVTLDSRYENHQDAAVKVALGGSVLDASQVSSIVLHSQKQALFLGEYFEPLPSNLSANAPTGMVMTHPTELGIGGDILVNMNNATVNAPVGLEDQAASTDATVVVRHVQVEPTDKAILNFTTSGESATKLYGNKKVPFITVEHGEAEFNLSGVDGSNDRATLFGSITQGTHSTFNLTKKERKVYFGNLDVNFKDATWNLAKAQSYDSAASSYSEVENELKNSVARHINLTNSVLIAHSESPDVARADANNHTITLQNRNEKELTVTGQINPTASLGNFTLSNSTIDLSQNGKVNDVLRLDGNYKADNAVLKVNTVWNDDASTSASDTLRVESGLVEGKTLVKAISGDDVEGILGDVKLPSAGGIIKSTDVVIAKADTAEDAFYGESKTAGIAKVRLSSELRPDSVANQPEKRHFFWTAGVNVSSAGEEPKIVDILDEDIVTMMNTAHASSDYALTTLSSIHIRRGWDIYEDKSTWGRFIHKNSQANGVRLSRKSQVNGAQVGISLGDTKRHNSSLYFSQLRGKLDAYDMYATENGSLVGKRVRGASNTKFNALGLNHLVRLDKAYVDVVVQLGWLNNKYRFLSGETYNQSGRSFAASIEGGYLLNFGDIKVEPQVQVVYQRDKLDGYRDALHTVKDYKHTQVTGRLGVNVATTNSRIPVYAGLHLLHSFKAPSALVVGKDALNERYAKTHIQGILGADLNLGKNVSLYGNLTYERNLSRKTMHQLAGATVGLKYQW